MKKPQPPRSAPKAKALVPSGSIDDQVKGVLAWLKSHSTKATLEGMARYGIPAGNALGVAVKDLKALAKLLGRNHDLALALWDTKIYEARMLTSFVGDPDKLTAAQMDRWCNDFDNWAYCDSLSFNLFDRTPHAWAKVTKWSRAKGEFQKRTAFALLWSLALHDRSAPDSHFIEGLKLIESAATDDRNFVKKAVSMALRAIATRASLKQAALGVARRLASDADTCARWVGKDALRGAGK